MSNYWKWVRLRSVGGDNILSLSLSPEVTWIEKVCSFNSMDLVYTCWRSWVQFEYDAIIVLLILCLFKCFFYNQIFRPICTHLDSFWVLTLSGPWVNHRANLRWPCGIECLASVGFEHATSPRTITFIYLSVLGNQIKTKHSLMLI